MATEKKEIIIEMKADLKNLLSNLKKMPGMTAKEARQMVNALEKEFKAANKAAKAAAKQQKTSMKTVQVSAKKAENSVRGLRKQSRELGGSFNAMGDVLSEVNPELGKFAMGAEVAGDSFRAVSRMLATGNPILIGIVLSISAAAAAYALFTSKANKSRKEQEALDKVLTRTTSTIQAQERAAAAAADAMNSHANAANQAALEYAVLNGSLTDTDAEMLQIEKRAGDMEAAILEEGAKREESLKKIKRASQAAVIALETRIKKLNESGEAYRTVNNAIGVEIQETPNLTALNRELAVEKFRLNEAETSLGTIQEENANLAAETAKNFLDASKKVIKARKKQERQQERKKRQLQEERELQKEAAEAAAKARKEQERIAALSVSISEAGQQASEQTTAILEQNAQMRIGLVEEEKQRLKEAGDMEIAQINQKIDKIKSQQIAVEGLVETAENQEEFRIFQLETEEQINALLEQRGIIQDQNTEKMQKLTTSILAQNIALAQSGVNQLGQIANATGTMIKNLSGDQKKAAMVQFRISQGVNIAEIGMETAKNIVKVFPDPVLTGLAAALGAAQIGVVASQPPPEFHMGGLINKGPDTQVITALKGEAILDRSTVREIGGDAGLRRLKEQGTQSQEVIVRTPFKHFDNYSKVSIKRGGALSKLQRTRSIGAY